MPTPTSQTHPLDQPDLLLREHVVQHARGAGTDDPNVERRYPPPINGCPAAVPDPLLNGSHTGHHTHVLYGGFHVCVGVFAW